jgi:uncharacterized protein YgiM (DUF1202 family)
VKPRLLLALLMTALVLTTSAIAPAGSEAAQRRSLCAKRANLRDSPDGFIIGRLRRPQRVTVLRRSANRRWTHVRVRGGLAGWIPSGSLCRG